MISPDKEKKLEERMKHEIFFKLIVSRSKVPLVAKTFPISNIFVDLRMILPYYSRTVII
jgi:hypothetical protein